MLANAVGVDSAGWSIIPYASRWTTASLGHEAAFTYYPRDLAYLSSLLKRDTAHDIRLVDGCLERLDADSYADRIADWRPDWLVMESSSRTFEDDARVARAVRERTGAKVLMAGQHPTAFPEETLAVADTVAAGEFLASVRDYFAGGAPDRRSIPFDPAGMIDVATLPFPEDDDVSRYDYALRADPICEYREIQVYATRGCPYGCLYCVARHAYYQGPSYRARPVADVVAELAAMAEKYPEAEGFFFDDEIHNVNRKFVRDLCRGIVDAGLDHLRYEAMCAYAPFDRETLELMRRAGYYKVRVGVETASDAVAEGLALGAKHRPDRLAAFLETAREVGMKVYGTFTLGGRGATADEDRKTVALMRSLLAEDLLSDCQVSVCTPQPGAPFHDWAVATGALGEAAWTAYDGGEGGVLSLPGYDLPAIRAMRAEALTAYDEARRERSLRRFREAWLASAKRFGLAGGKALLFRSGRRWQMELAVRSLREAGYAIGLVTVASAADEMAALAPDAPLFFAGEEGFLRREGVGPETVEALRAFGADLLVIPTNNEKCRGYENVLRVADAAGDRGRVMYLTAEGGLVEAFPTGERERKGETNGRFDA